jgi:hypothetical protein
MVDSQSIMRPILKKSAMLLLLMVGLVLCTNAQTGNTGKLTGAVTDQSRAIVPAASVEVVNEATAERRMVSAGEDGVYSVPLLPPGTYKVKVSKEGFKTAVRSGVIVNVTETTTLPVELTIGSRTETITVTSTGEALQTQSSTLGDVVNDRSVSTLPLVTRNFGEILNLSSGVSTSLTNAAEVGRGSSSGEGGIGSSSGGSKDVNGDRAYDNNFMINGLQVNDQFAVGIFGGINQTGGFAVPNPDTIQEFKVQTGQYDASYGRNAGAQINVITKSGQNQFHGALFEYFRNEDLDANDFFRNLVGEPRGELRQNQFGGAIGGPILKNKLLFFGSYQGTRQINAIASQCSGFVAAAPATLTDNRTAAGLGAAFAGQRGVDDTGTGLAIAADGSNINPSALLLFQAKAPNGQYLIPTPQIVVQTPAGPVGQGEYSVPCTFNENQFVTNLDYEQSEKNTFAVRFIGINSSQLNTMSASNVPYVGAQDQAQRFRVGSAHYTHVFSPHIVNQASGGIYTIANLLPKSSIIGYPALGINTPMGTYGLINLTIGGLGGAGISTGGAGSYSLVSSNPASQDQLGWELNDTLSWVKGAHTVRFGGDLIRQELNETSLFTPESVVFQSVPDLLLGRAAGPVSAGGNGTAFSNVYEASSNFEKATATGKDLTPRQLRNWDISGFVQDDWKVLHSLTVNLGLRYEFMGDITDNLGRLAFVDSKGLNPNPPGLTLQGFIVAHNYDRLLNPLPAGVTVSPNDSALANDSRNTLNPRFGFAWQEVPKLVLRGGYGIYHVNPPMVSIFAATQQGAPWAGITTGGNNEGNAALNAATLQNPYPLFTQDPSITTLPEFHPYGLQANGTYTNYYNFFLNQDWRPAYAQTYTLNQQVEVLRDMIITVGYVGVRSLHLAQPFHFNQPLFASPSNPIRGQTTNSLANIQLRTPYLGVATNAPQQENNGVNNYNALQASLRKRLRHGLQLLVSYTWSKDLDSAGPWTSLSPVYGGGATPGNAYAPHKLYGPSSYNRPQVFVASYTYDFPRVAGGGLVKNVFVNGWELAGVTAIQSGTSLTVYGFNPFSAFAQGLDVAELSGACPAHSVETHGSVQSRRNNYFNQACFTGFSYPVIDPSGATGFGNGGIGTAQGPDQNNWDIGFIKHTKVRRLNESANVEFRAEFFNAFNHPQFANPGGEPPVNVNGTPGFGSISALSVNPRIIQFALRLNF